MRLLNCDNPRFRVLLEVAEFLRDCGLLRFWNPLSFVSAVQRRLFRKLLALSLDCNLADPSNTPRLLAPRSSRTVRTLRLRLTPSDNRVV